MEWDADDRDKAMAFLMEDAERCSLCGTTDREWDEDRFAFVAVEHFCRGCYTEHMASEGKETLPGTTYRLVHRNSAEARRIREREQRFQEDDEGA